MIEAGVLACGLEVGSGVTGLLPRLLRISAPKPRTPMAMTAIAAMTSGDGRRLTGPVGT